LFQDYDKAALFETRAIPEKWEIFAAEISLTELQYYTIF
jgi:hypothetical protein